MYERRLALARSLHRKRSNTQQRALELRVAIDTCRSSLRTLDSRVGALAPTSGDVRALQDRLHACATHLEHALVNLATLASGVR